MEKAATNNDEVAQAVAAYLAADEATLLSLRRLHDAWRRHLEEDEEPPSTELIATVAAQQSESDLALERARSAVAMQASTERAAYDLMPNMPPLVRARRRRKRENKFLRAIGAPGKRILRALILIALLVSALVTCGAGISLTLEVAGFLRLIDDPTQLPVGIQLAIFFVGAGAAIGLKMALKSVERALYGSKGVRPRIFSL